MSYNKERHASVLRSLLPVVNRTDVAVGDGGSVDDNGDADPFNELLGRLVADMDDHHFESIDLARCDDNPNQIRRGDWKNDPHLEELAASLAQHGQINPISVIITGDRYRIVCGHRRVAAMRRLGWSRVQAKVYRARAAASEMLELMADNLLRKSCTRIEILTGLKRLRQLGVSQDVMAGIIGVNQSTISRYLQVAELPEAYLTANEKREINFRQLQTLAFIADPAEREKTFARFSQERKAGAGRRTGKPKTYKSPWLQAVWRPQPGNPVNQLREVAKWLTEVAWEYNAHVVVEVKETDAPERPEPEV